MRSPVVAATPGLPRAIAEIDGDDVDERGERHGEQGTGDAGDHGAAGDHEHDGERVHLDGGAHEQRLEDVALELLDAEDDDEHPQRDPRAVVDEGEEDRERAGDDGADDRHEGAEEDQHARSGSPAAHRAGRRRAPMPIASIVATSSCVRA